jgi:hypothetical protein
MEEGNWISMSGVPLITTEGATAERGAAADTDGGGADAQSDDACDTEGVARPDVEAIHDDRAEGPPDDAERTMATVCTIVAASTSPEAAAALDGDAVPAPNEDAHAAASTRGPPGGDASEMAHAAELKATLLAASSPEHEAPLSLWAPSRLNLCSSPPKPRSEGP